MFVDLARRVSHVRAESSAPTPDATQVAPAPADEPAADEPSAKPSPATVRASRRRTSLLEEAVRAAVEAASGVATRTSDVPFGDRDPTTRRADLDTARQTFDASNDPAAFDDVDTFRANLPENQQQIYDSELARLRDDDRINFEYHDGAQRDPALEEIAIRGIMAQTFGRPHALERVLNTATNYELDEVPDFSGSDRTDGAVREVDGTGQFDIHVFPPSRDLGYSGGAPASGDLTVRSDEVDNLLADAGDNLFVHEFAHAEQGARADGVHDKQLVPEDFPDQDAFEEHLASKAFSDLLAAQGLNADGLEAYPTVAKLFKEDPEAFRAAAPEFYDLMRQYFDRVLL